MRRASARPRGAAPQSPAEAATPSTRGRTPGDPSSNPPIQVVPLDLLRNQSRRFDARVRVVVDASDQVLPIPDLARLAVLRRRVRACGGDLIVVAGSETASLLRRHRLAQAVPCEGSVAAAIGALTDSAPMADVSPRSISKPRA